MMRYLHLSVYGFETGSALMNIFLRESWWVVLAMSMMVLLCAMQPLTERSA